VTSLAPSVKGVARALNIELAERPPVDATESTGGDSHRSSLRIVVLVERPDPAAWSVGQVARFARRLEAEVLIAAIFAHSGSLDDLDRANLRMLTNGVREVRSTLVQQGVQATAEVTLARYGDQALVASDLADRLDADLVIVLARRGSWFGVFPGSPLAHDLIRGRRRPVLVIPDHERRRAWFHVRGGRARPAR
jgi:nucleotide-binding universal stress UspA family protein